MNIDNNFIFPKFNLEDIDIKNEFNFCINKIKDVQDSNSNNSECFLSFYAIAKNIRFISSYYFNSIKSGSKPIISNSCRPGEDNFWMSMTNDNWYPWIWSRGLNANSNYDAWNKIFKPIERSVDKEFTNITNEVNDFYLYITSLSHIFTVNDEYKDRLYDKYVNFDLPDKIIGLQIRRGEIVPKDGNVDDAWNGRPIYHIDDYMNGIELISNKIGTKNIFVSTDSKETIDYLINNYKEYNFYYNNFDRELFLRYGGKDTNVGLEFDLLKNIDLISHYLDSGVIDLLMLSNCDAYVGGMSWSEYGATGWFLQMGNKKCITPYYNVEGEFDINSKQVGLLLI